MSIYFKSSNDRLDALISEYSQLYDNKIIKQKYLSLLFDTINHYFASSSKLIDMYQDAHRHELLNILKWFHKYYYLDLRFNNPGDLFHQELFMNALIFKKYQTANYLFSRMSSLTQSQMTKKYGFLGIYKLPLVNTEIVIFNV